MTELQGGISKKSPTTELDIINQKRAALQKLVQLTCTLNRLHQGLQSVLLMGHSASQIPEKIINKFRTLSDGLKSKSTTVLQNTLSSTEQKIQRDIKHVLDISQKSSALLEVQLGTSGNKLADILKEDYHASVNNFKKKSQTSITLRIALKTRDAVVKSFNLPVPESFIQQQIISLHHKEKECRRMVRKDMETLQEDVDILMHKDDCPEDIKNILSEIKADLKLNTEYFDAGKAIDKIPIMYESIELSGDAPIPEEETTEAKEVSHPEKKQAETDEAETSLPVIKKTGLISRLWLWLNSPWNTKWKDLD